MLVCHANMISERVVPSSESTLSPQGNPTLLPEAVQEAKELLRVRYKVATVSLAQGLCEEQVLLLEDIYVNIIVLSRQEIDEVFANSDFGSQSDQRRLEHVFQPRTRSSTSSSSGDCSNPIVLADLFEPDEDEREDQRKWPCNILVLGCAGSGKSTVFHSKAAYDWANGEIWQRFDLLLCLQLRDPEVQRLKNSEELIQHVLPQLSGREREDVVKFIRRQPQRVCLIIDGLDECHLSQCTSYIRSLVKGECQTGLCTIVTSRPSSEASEVSCGSQFQRRLEVVGFSPDNVSNYIDKVLRKEKAKSMKKQLEENHEVSYLMATPIVAALCCQHFKMEKKVPRSVTELFSLVITRLSMIHDKRVAAANTSSSLSSRACLVELGHLAFTKLLSKQLQFTEEDLDRAGISSEARGMGLLVESQKLHASGKRHLFCFSHLMLQEFLAAWYACNVLILNDGDLKELVEQIGFAEGSTNTFWSFLSGLLDDVKAESLLSCLVVLLRETGGQAKFCSPAGSAYADMLLSETQINDIIGILSSKLNQRDMLQLADELLSDVCGDGESGRKVVENSLERSREPTDIQYLETLIATWKSKVGFASGRRLCRALNRISQDAESVCFTYFCGDSESKMLSRFEIQDGNTNISRGFRILSRCFAEHVLCSTNPIPSDSITCFLLTYHDDIWNTSKTVRLPSEASQRALVIHYHCPCVHAATVSFAVPEVGSILLSPLVSCSRLTKLSIYGFGKLSNEEVSLIPLVLEGSKNSLLSINLQQCTTDEAHDTDGIIARMAAVEFSSLRQLHLNRLDIDSVSVHGVLTLLTSCHHLTILSLNENPDLGDANIAAIAKVLSLFCPSLVELHLNKTGLTCSGLPGLNPAFQRCQSLQSAYLCGNNLIAEDDDCIYAVLDFVKVVKTSSNLDAIFLGHGSTIRDSEHDLLQFLLFELVQNDDHSLTYVK